MNVSQRISHLRPATSTVSRRQLSIRWYLAMFGLAIVVPMLLVSGMLLTTQATAVRERSQREALQIARNIADDIDRKLDATISVVQVLSLTPALQNANFPAFDGLARNIAKLRGTDFVMRDLAGHQVVNTRIAPGVVLPDGYDTELRRVDRLAVETGRPVVSNLLTDDAGPHIAISLPVLHDGKPIYTLNASLSPERITEVLTARELPPQFVTAIADGNLQVLARSDDSEKYLGAGASQRFHQIPAGVEGEWLECYNKRVLNGRDCCGDYD